MINFYLSILNNRVDSINPLIFTTPLKFTALKCNSTHAIKINEFVLCLR